MELDNKIKEFIKIHKDTIGIFQWAITASVTSLIYSEYIRCIKNKYVPVHKVHVPSIKTVSNLLSIDNKFMIMLKEKFIDLLVDHPMIKKYSIASEIIILNNDRDIMKTIFNDYMLPSVSKRIPVFISTKFDLGNANQSMIIEDSHIDMFKKFNITDTNTLDFIIEEFVLQFLTSIPSMKKELEFPESNSEIYITANEIVSIGNEQAICPILINNNIIQNKSIFDLLAFVSSTSIEHVNHDINHISKLKDGIPEDISYKMNTNVFNQICISTLKGIDIRPIVVEESDA